MRARAYQQNGSSKRRIDGRLKSLFLFLGSLNLDGKDKRPRVAHHRLCQRLGEFTLSNFVYVVLYPEIIFALIS